MRADMYEVCSPRSCCWNNAQSFSMLSVDAGQPNIWKEFWTFCWPRVNLDGRTTRASRSQGGPCTLMPGSCLTWCTPKEQTAVGSSSLLSNRSYQKRRELASRSQDALLLWRTKKNPRVHLLRCSWLRGRVLFASFKAASTVFWKLLLTQANFPQMNVMRCSFLFTPPLNRYCQHPCSVNIIMINSFFGILSVSPTFWWQAFMMSAHAVCVHEFVFLPVMENISWTRGWICMKLSRNNNWMYFYNWWSFGDASNQDVHYCQQRYIELKFDVVVASGGPSTQL